MLGNKKPTIRLSLMLALLNLPPNFIPAEMAPAPSTRRLAGEAEIETALKLFAGKTLSGFFSYLDEVRPKTSDADAKRMHEMLAGAITLATVDGRLTAGQIPAHTSSASARS